MEEQYGTFECKICGKVYHSIKAYYGHLGAHRSGISKKRDTLRCKFCNVILTEGKNWPAWAVRQRNIICNKCKIIQNRESYKKNRLKKIEERKQRKLENMEATESNTKVKGRLKSAK